MNQYKMKKSIALLEEEFKRLEIEKKKIAQSIVKSNKVVLKDVDNNYYYTDETLENRINELKQLVIKIKAEIKFIDDCIFHLSYLLVPLDKIDEIKKIT